MSSHSAADRSQTRDHGGRSTTDWRSSVPFYYGWMVVAVVFLVLALIYTVWYGFSVFFVALLEEYGWSRASSAGVFSLFVMVVGFGGMATGALTDRFGPERMLAVGATIIALGFLASSQITELWQFYLSFGVVSAVGVSAAGWVPCVATVNRWFSLRLGTALGIASAGIAASLMVMVPFSQWLISSIGWRPTFVILAGIIFVGVVPVALLTLRGKPEDLGLQRDGYRNEDGGQPNSKGILANSRSGVVDAKWAGRNWNLTSAARTSRFWLLFLMMTLANIFIQMVFVHQVAFLVDGGYDKLVAASVVGLIGFLGMFAKMWWGWASDWLGREASWSIGLGILTLSIVLLMMTRLAPFPYVIYLFSLAFAVGYGAIAPLMPSIAADVFAGRSFGAVYGALAVSNGVGSAIGSWLAGYIFDVTGSYMLAFGLAIGITIVCLALVWMVAPRKIRRVAGRT